MFFSVTMKKFCFKIVLLNLNLLSLEVFDDTFMLETSHSKIPKLFKSSTTLDLFQRLKMKTPYFFLTLKEVERITNS